MCGGNGQGPDQYGYIQEAVSCEGRLLECMEVMGVVTDHVFY